MLQEEFKCPNCGGNRYKHIDQNAVKCIYCGTIFIIQSKQKESKETESEKEAERFLTELGKDIKQKKTKGEENYILFILILIIIGVLSICYGG